MLKQDWLDYFEAINGRSASAEEIAQALAAGEFVEETVAPQETESVVAPEAPAPEYVAAPEAPVAPAPEYVATPEAPVAPAPEYVAAPEAPVAPAPEYVVAPEAPVSEAPTAPFSDTVEPPVQPTPTQSIPQATPQQAQTGFAQGQGNPGYPQAPFPAQPNPFGQAVSGFGNWFIKALIRPTHDGGAKVLYSVLHYIATAFLLTIGSFFIGYGSEFRTFMIQAIMVYFAIFAFQFAGFFVRRVLFQDKSFSYGRSFDLFGRLSAFALPFSLVAFIMGIARVYDIFAIFVFLIFALYAIGTTFTVYEGLNRTPFKADKFWLLVASSAVLFIYGILVMYFIARLGVSGLSGYFPSFPSLPYSGF